MILHRNRTIFGDPNQNELSFVSHFLQVVYIIPASSAANARLIKLFGSKHLLLLTSCIYTDNSVRVSGVREESFTLCLPPPRLGE